MNETTESLMDKNVNDLTVGDALKINLAIMAACAAIPLTIMAGAAVKEKVTNWRREHKKSKFEVVKD